MMSYRDMTFCSGGELRCAKFATCPRALTEAVKDNAERWWGGPNAPITRYAYPEKLSCYEAPALAAIGKANGGGR